MMAIHSPSGRLWQPSALHRPILIAFALLFAVIAFVIVALFNSSNRHNGIATPQTKLRYLWTYGPSACFILISGLWAAVSQATKTLSPWLALLREPAFSKSLSLDYTTPNQFSVLYRSWKNAHWPVTLAVFGSLCLDLLIILSTGLLRLKQVDITNPTFSFPMKSSLNRTALIPEDGQTSYAFSTAYAVGMYNLDVPVGTTKDFAYAKADTSTIPRNATAQVVVDAIYPGVSCQAANSSVDFGFTFPSNSSNGTASFLFKASHGNCNLTWWMNAEDYQLQYYDFQFRLLNCSAPDSSNAYTTTMMIYANHVEMKSGNITGNKPNRTSAITVEDSNSTTIVGRSYGHLKEPFVPVSGRIASASLNIVMCTTQPQLRKASVVLDRGSWLPNLLDIGHIGHNSTGGFEVLNTYDHIFGGPLDYQLSNSVINQLTELNTWLSGVGDISSPNYDNTSGGNLDTLTRGQRPLFRLFNATNPRQTADDFLDTDYLSNVSQSTFQLVFAQALAEAFFPPTVGTTSTGSVSVTESRLVVSKPAFGLLIALLILMVMVSLALCMVNKAAIPKDPGSIASKATIIASSPNVVDSAREQTNSRSENDNQYAHNDTAWWHPWSISLYCRLLVLFLPCGAIAVLEGLQMRSDRNQGIATVSFNSYLQYTWVYLPVLIIFLMNTIFTAISATNRIIQPYVTMRRKPTANSLRVDLINKITISAIWSAMRLRDFATAASILATLLGATLPIAASGLYRIQNVQHNNLTMSVQQASVFDPSASINENGSIYPVPGFVLYQNLSFPPWTYGKYALPEVVLSTDHKPALNITATDNLFLSVDLPAVYGVANCSVVSSDIVSFKVMPPLLAPDITIAKTFIGSVDIKLNLPPDCPPMSLGGGQIQATDFFIAQLISLDSESTKINTTSVPAAAKNASAATYHGGAVFPKHCPYSIAIFAEGHFQPSQNKTKPGTLTMGDSAIFQCSPYMSQETVNVEFTVPDFNTSLMRPPVPKPGTRTYFSEAEIMTNYAASKYIGGIFTMGTNDTSTWTEDQFFGAVFHGVDGSPASSFLPINDDSINRLQNRIEEVYGTVVGQLYGAQRRFQPSAQDEPVHFNATLLKPEVARLQQDLVSTRIIQGILGLMLICAVLSIVMINGKELLPQNPCTIEGVASLLVHSTILNEISPGSELLNDKELQKRGILQYGLFSLGWWGNAEKRWYGIDMGRADKERDVVKLNTTETNRSGSSSSVVKKPVQNGWSEVRL